MNKNFNVKTTKKEWAGVSYVEPSSTGLSPSELNRRIELQAPSRVADGSGGFVITHVPKATVWAKIATLVRRSQEEMMAMQSTGSVVHNIMIRYRADVRGNWRVKYGDKFYNIIGPPIDVDKAHRWLDIRAREVA